MKNSELEGAFLAFRNQCIWLQRCCNIYSCNYMKGAMRAEARAKAGCRRLPHGRAIKTLKCEAGVVITNRERTLFSLNLLTTPAAPIWNGTILLKRSLASLERRGMSHYPTAFNSSTAS
jgi:hypothetical protein